MTKSAKKQDKVKKLSVNYELSDKDFTPLPKFIEFKPKNQKQKMAYESIKDHDINFFVGKVGSGKSTIPTIYAINELLKGNIKKIILIRPAKVDKDEELGFLKGDLDQKIAPLILPLKSIIVEQLSETIFERMNENKQMQGFSVAHARGMTFKNSFVIVDEAQNLTRKNLRMLLTRIDDSSKMAICGDLEQCDLDDFSLSSFNDIDIFKNEDSINIVEFNSSDVVRGRMTAVVERCYAKLDKVDVVNPNKDNSDFRIYLDNKY